MGWNTRFAWAGGTFFLVVLYVVSVLVLAGRRFWFNFGSNTYLLLRVQYSCGGALVFYLQWEIVFGVLHILSVQYSCAVASVFWM